MIGLIFWVVISKKKLSHDNPSTRLGTHIWRGAAPIFNINAKNNNNELKEEINICVTLDKIIIDAIAWIIKYFIATSLWYFLYFLKIRGININTLISKQIQIISQELEEMIKKMENIRKTINKKFAGWKKI